MALLLGIPSCTFATWCSPYTATSGIAELTDTAPEDDAVLDTPSLTKKQKKKLRQKEAREAKQKSKVQSDLESEGEVLSPRKILKAPAGSDTLAGDSDDDAAGGAFDSDDDSDDMSRNGAFSRKSRSVSKTNGGKPKVTFEDALDESGVLVSDTAKEEARSEVEKAGDSGFEAAWKKALASEDGKKSP